MPNSVILLVPLVPELVVLEGLKIGAPTKPSFGFVGRGGAANERALPLPLAAGRGIWSLRRRNPAPASAGWAWPAGGPPGRLPGPALLSGKNRQVVRSNKKKDQLTLCGFYAALGDLADAHELTGRLMFPQLFFLFSVQIDTSLPHCLHPHVRRLGAIVQQLIGFG